MQVLMPLCACPKCGAHAIVLLTPAQRFAQPDDTTHVCHPTLGGCNHGFTDDRTRRSESGLQAAFPKRLRAVHFVDSQGRPLAGSAALYGWIIDRETVSDETNAVVDPDLRTSSRVGWTGPRDIAPAIEQQLRNGQGQRFKMFDDDGNLYYEGRYIGPDDETAFGPLTDLGTPDAGATRIDYQGRNGRWATL